MKAFYAFVIFGVLFAVSMANWTPEQRFEFQQKLLDECKGSSQANEEEIAGLKNYEVPKTRNGKCLLACTQEKVGLIVDGKLSVEGAKALGAKKYEGDMKKIGIFNDMVDECSNIAHDDKCELGAKMMECMINAFTKRGYNPKDGIQD